MHSRTIPPLCQPQPLPFLWHQGRLQILPESPSWAKILPPLLRPLLRLPSHRRFLRLRPRPPTLTSSRDLPASPALQPYHLYRHTYRLMYSSRGPNSPLEDTMAAAVAP